ncbi:M56 family metallopeptidase [Pedobacter paludis]|uniref:Peptidase M56 domain-containing protein n=1 Tax=Pedobacter paludis TaxID=2203212 RepID=A0A317EVH0_9SPHI|nr:M56 family metallopeptidase [Pedobacter paludis]PWS30950.1 hypothetical protein DF947_15215 [Pedobacter paludis]
MEWLIYLLKVSACSAMFFGFYLFILRKLTFFKINRFYLLTTLLLSFLIPALQFSLIRTVDAVNPIISSYPPSTQVYASSDVQPSIQTQLSAKTTISQNFDWLEVTQYGYILIAICLLSICAWRLLQLTKFARNHTETVDGLRLVPKKTGFTNCSFFNYVFINEDSLTLTELQVLLRHEQVHANQFHSIDKILLMVFKAVLWFNPIVYLYDKALEEVHEFEADETTSLSFGHQTYAGILLKFAVAKSDVPLIHNFVKSPIKERIKMLFNSKSTDMKKWIYCSIIPMGLILIWLFAVQVVYAQNEVGKNVENKEASALIGKTVTGKIIGFEKLVTGNVLQLESGNKIYPIECSAFRNKLTNGDKLTASVSGYISKFKITNHGVETIVIDQPVYTISKVAFANGTLIWKSEKHAFLYEINKARFAESRIKSIKRDKNGIISKIILNDGTFTINLNIENLKIKKTEFKSGDSVLVKFIGEKLISKNVYSTDKMIVLASLPKKYELKDEELYNRFYTKEGWQKISTTLSDTTKLNPSKIKVVSFQTMIGANKDKISHFKDVLIEINGDVLKAEEVELDNLKYKLTAKNAQLNSHNGNILESEKIIFDLKNRTYYTNQIPGSFQYKSDNSINKNLELKVAYKNPKDNLETKIEYRAVDSVRISKDKSIVYLYGDAKISYGNVVLTGSEIIYNKNLNTAKAKHANLISDANKPAIKADSLKFNFDNSKVQIFGKGSNK